MLALDALERLENVLADERSWNSSDTQLGELVSKLLHQFQNISTSRGKFRACQLLAKSFDLVIGSYVTDEHCHILYSDWCASDIDAGFKTSGAVLKEFQNDPIAQVISISE